MKALFRFIGTIFLLTSIFCGVLVAIYSIKFLKDKWIEWWQVTLMNLGFLLGGGFISIMGLLFIYLGIPKSNVNTNNYTDIAKKLNIEDIIPKN